MGRESSDKCFFGSVRLWSDVDVHQTFFLVTSLYTFRSIYIKRVVHFWGLDELIEFKVNSLLSVPI